MSDMKNENTNIIEELPELPNELERYLNMPYGGLFGDNIQAKIIEEIVADPYCTYQPKDFEEITGATVQTIIKILNNLTMLKLLKKEITDDKNILYRPNIGSRKIVALTFLSYALIDDRDDSDIMDNSIKDYFLKVLKPKR